MKKIIFFVLMFLNAFNCFLTYGFTRYSQYSLNGKEDIEYYGEIVFSEKEREVKMTQDDEYYYFNIKQDVVAPCSDNNILQIHYDNTHKYATFNNGANMQILLAPFSNVYDLYHRYLYNDEYLVEEHSGFGIGSSNIFHVAAWKEKWTKSGVSHMFYYSVQNDIGTYTSGGRSYPMCYYLSKDRWYSQGSIKGQREFSGWEERYGRGGPNRIGDFVTYNIPKLSDDEEDVPLTMPEVLSTTCTKVVDRYNASPNSHYWYVKELEMIFDYKIKIKKDNLNVFDNTGNCISPFRYCNVVSKDNFNASDGSHTFPYCSCINNSIDLAAYIDCNHKWIFRDNMTRYEHTKYCNKCKWEKVEAHNFIYDYDGITNNRCVCKTNKNVYITIKDNIGKINERFIATPSCSLHSVEWEDIGYDFLNVSDKELVYTDIDSHIYIISTTSCIPTIVPENSHEYYINYYTHKYYINYNKTNNLNLAIENTMDTKVVEYGERVKLDKSLYGKTGYTFLGWAVEPNLNDPVFSDEKEIYNISSEDGYVLNLYPVYDAYSYIIKFTSGRGKGYMQDQVCTYGVCENIKGYEYMLDDEAVFINWRYKGIDIRPNVTSSIEPFVRCDNDVITLQTNIYVRERNEKASWENSPTKKPGGARINTDIGPGIKVEEKPVENVVFVVDKKYEIKNENKINVKEDGEKDRMYIMLASGSIVRKISADGNIKDNKLLYGVLLAMSIVGKMAFCMTFVFIFVVFLAMITYGRKAIMRHIKI